MIKIKKMKYLIILISVTAMTVACKTQKIPSQAIVSSISTKSAQDEKIDEVLQRDTIVFDKTYSLQEFVDLFEIKKGILRLRELPSGKLKHYNTINAGVFENELTDISEGVYFLDLRYGFEIRQTKMIRKTIRIVKSEREKHSSKKI